MSKFDEIINTKLSQLSEADQVAGPTPTAGTPATGTATATQAQPTTGQPEQALQQALSQVPYNNPDAATKMLNTAIQSLKANQHFTNYFSNLGFAKGQFQYVANKPQPNATTPGQAGMAPVQPPGTQTASAQPTP